MLTAVWLSGYRAALGTRTSICWSYDLFALDEDQFHASVDSGLLAGPVPIAEFDENQRRAYFCMRIRPTLPLSRTRLG